MFWYAVGTLQILESRNRGKQEVIHRISGVIVLDTTISSVINAPGDCIGFLFLAGVSLEWGGGVVFPRQSESIIQTIKGRIS